MIYLVYFLNNISLLASPVYEKAKSSNTNNKIRLPNLKKNILFNLSTSKRETTPNTILVTQMLQVSLRPAMLEVMAQ